MISLAVVLFFSVTGITLNHPDWFFSAAESTRENEGEISPAWLHLRKRSAPTRPNPVSQAIEADQAGFKKPRKKSLNICERTMRFTALWPIFV